MESFSFYNPSKIHFGQGQIRLLGAEMASAGIKKCLLVAGQGSIKKNTAYQQVMDSLKQAGIESAEAWGVRPNPDLDTLRRMIDLAKKEKVDAVLAVGGGSVIDTAKAIAAGVFNKDIWAVFTGEESIEQALPLYTVLTISGTGSEMNGNSVISNTEKQQKWAIGSVHLYPKLSIIDPALQSTLSFRQTASGAVDAISHILEYQFADAGAKVSLDINIALIKNIIAATDILQKEPGNYQARANLAWAATMALNGVSQIGLKGGDWGCHAVEHSLSALYPSISHGEGLAVILPSWIGYVNARNPALFGAWAKKLWGKLNISEALHEFREKLAAWELPGTLRDLGIQEQDLPLLLEIILGSSKKCVGGIYRLNEDDLQTLLLLAF